MKRDLGYIVYVVAVLALLILGAWAWFAGPCWIYSWSKVGEIPARCFLELSR